MPLEVCFHVVSRTEWLVWQITEMENQIKSQEQEVSSLEMVVNESERCVSLVVLFFAFRHCYSCFHIGVVSPQC